MSSDEHKIVDSIDARLEAGKENEPISEDSDTESETAIYQSIVDAVRLNGEKELKGELNQFLESHLEESNTEIKKKGFTFYLGIAASVTLLIGAVFFVINNHSSEEPIRFEKTNSPSYADSALYTVDSVRQDSIR